MRAKGIEQVSDTGSIESAIEQILAGNEKIFGFLVGQVMKATQGKASPHIVNEFLRKKLQSRPG